MVGGLSISDELLVLCLAIGVVARGDEGWHIERLSHVGAAAVDEAFPSPLSGLARETSERCSLLVIGTVFTSKFGVSGCSGRCPSRSLDDTVRPAFPDRRTEPFRVRAAGEGTRLKAGERTGLLALVPKGDEGTDSL